MDYGEILEDYIALRKAIFPINRQLCQSLSGTDLRHVGTKLGMLNGDVLEVESEDEINLLFDYAIHDVFHNENNAVDRMLLNSPPPEGTHESRILHSLQKSFFTLFQSDRQVPGVGVFGRVWPDDQELFVVDAGLSQTLDPGSAIAARLHSPGAFWWMTTGAILPLNEESTASIFAALSLHEKETGEKLVGPEFSAIVIKECLNAGASQHIQYVDFNPKKRPASKRKAQRTRPAKPQRR